MNFHQMEIAVTNQNCPSYGDSIRKSKEFHQMEIAKRLNAIIAQLLPFLSQEVIKMMLLYRDLI